MSLKASTWAWSVTDVTATERLLLLNLADFAAPHGRELQHHCWPAQETLAERSCVSVRQVQRLLDSVAERGLVKRERRSSREGRLTDRYWLPVWEDQPDNMSGSATRHTGPSNTTPMSQQHDIGVRGTVSEPEEEPTPPGPPKGGKRRSRMTAGAQPTQQHRDDADRLAPGLNLDTEWARFRDYHLAKGSLFADWTAAWRTWLRRTDEYKRAHDPEYGWR